MATNINDVPGIEDQITRLKNQASTYQSALNSSSTALGGSGTPTSFDIKNQESLQSLQKQIQNLTDQKLRTQWYGTDTSTSATTEGESESGKGIIGTTLDYLARPLYGVVGAAKHIVGQGEGSLYQDVADNMVRNKNTFGDVLKTAGVPWAVSAPLGFALDVGMDPVNWLTMGSSALVPRLAEGAVKGFTTGEGLIEGLSTAAKSGLMEKANTVGRLTPFLRKTNIMTKFGESTLAATDAFESLTGRTAAKIVTERGMGIGSYRIGLGEVINKVADAIPGGQKVLQNFVYDPVEWVRQARIKDIVQESLGTGVDLKGAVNAGLKGESIKPFLEEAAQKVEAQIKSTPPGKAFDINIDPNVSIPTSKEVDQFTAKLAGMGIDKKFAAVAPSIVSGVDDASSILKNPTPFISGDPLENAVRIANEKVGGEAITLEDIAKMVNSGALDETGVKWFDSMQKSIRNFELKIGKGSNEAVKIGKIVMDKYDQALGIFRVAKVGASPTAYVNNVVGNVAMYHMATGGVDMTYLERVKQSFDLYRNKTGAASLIDDLMMNAGRAMGNENAIKDALGEMKTAARGTFGSLDFANAKYNAEKVLTVARDAGIVPASVKAEDIASDIQKALEEVSQAMVTMKAGTQPVRSLLATGKNITRGELGTGMLTNEMFNSSATAQMFDYISKKAAEDTSKLSAWKLLDFTFNKMSSKYETIDQSFKMATFLRSTVDGYSLGQLRNMRSIIDINPEELTRYAKNGQYLYRLSPKAGLELANVVHLNYGAMPAAIRVLRNFPLLGSPFVSFMYGMTLKAGQTLAYNPSAFNKVTFAINDFGGTKTPLEKKALNTDFYSYLKQPGMFRMPGGFFDKNPVYLNLTNVIPYYSLNMFNPSQTRYTGGTVGEKIAQAVQQSPILKDPAGSVIFDYLIQPMILGEAISPQGQFGQPLYPMDASGLTKVGYGLRSLGEAYMPNIASYAGLLTPDAVADYIPSYRWRQLSRAKVGKNQLGISGKEPAVSRTVRTLLQATGVPVQAPVNTTFSQNSQ
jgi:hypothetical protein